ncbi:Aste57867_66 [Aphanomyces stellatus]|uniref:Aste57867_66 protein n=1 Tax=Aphanomyces stellatus TaxID=120398 RepID=A0A485K1N5_9STRA|nr:hypothetical protein As57867_000066 [Aphanomyces stellatus]VFT77292.1 Aste57867_66 [Aphanomyces stellatus]
MTRHANFRRTYYKSLGVPVLQSVEVEASFASLLGEDTPTPAITINLSQLVRLTLEFGLPAVHRSHVWCIASHIFPLVRDAEADTWGFVRNERRIMYVDIAAAADVCEAPQTELSITRRLIHLHRFYVDCVRPNLHSMLSTLDEAECATEWVLGDVRVVESVAVAVQQVLDETSDQFWCLVAFLDILDRGFHSLQPPVPVEELYDISPLALEIIIFRLLALACS